MSQISITVAAEEKALTAAVQTLSERIPALADLPAKIAGIHLEDASLSIRLETEKGDVNIKVSAHVSPEG